MDTPIFANSNLEQICKVLADTNTGLTGSTIVRYLNEIGINNEGPVGTKWTHLYAALSEAQSATQNGSFVILFIERAMDPVNYSRDPERFKSRQVELNGVLGFCGYRLEDDGQLVIISPIQTLTQAQQRANNLYERLEQRGTHQDVLYCCKAELLVENYFHAVFEATKSVADKIRQRTGLEGDGSALVDAAFGSTTPRMAINSLDSDTYRSEQSGFLNLLKGAFGTFRNVTAHAPKITWPIEEQDALDLMSLISYIHRRIDKAVVRP